MTRKANDPAERADADNPEWTRAMMRKARPASEVLPGIIGQQATDELMRRKPGRPALEDKKLVAMTVRVEPAVADAYRATGNNWTKLAAKTLKDHAPGRK